MTYTDDIYFEFYQAPRLSTYTITYKPGANGTGTTQTATKTKDVALTLKGAVFTRTGFTQTGWSTSDGGPKAYDLSASYTANAAATLYPYWTAASTPTYTIFYDYDGGTYDGQHGENETSMSYDKWFDVGSPVKSGYKFVGWTVSSGLDTNTAKWCPWTGTTAKLTSASTLCYSEYGIVSFFNLRSTAGTVTLKANWTYVGKPELAFYEPDIWPAAVFLTSEKGSTSPRTSFTQNEIFYVSFAYKNAGAANAGGHLASVVVTDKDCTTALAGIDCGCSGLSANSTCHRNSVLFAATWEPGTYRLYVYLDSSDDIDESNENNNGRYVEFTVTAAPTPTYTITYRPGSNCTGNPQTATKTKDVALTLLGETFTRTGYTQTGWSTSDGGPKAYSLSASYTANAAATLYPYWTATSVGKPVVSTSGNEECVRLDWDPALNADGYSIWRATSASGTKSRVQTQIITTTSYNTIDGVMTALKHHYAEDTTATPGVDYWYWVEATKGSVSTYSDSVSNYRRVSLSLSKNGLSFVSAGCSDSVSVTANTSWTATKTKDWLTLATSGTSGNGSVGISATANSGTAGRSDTITVKAGGSTSHPVSKTISVTQTGAATPAIPPQPTGVSATQGTYADKVVFTWSASSGAATYRVFRQLASSTSIYYDLIASGMTSCSYTDTAVTPGTHYRYVVAAFNSANERSAYSSPAEGWAAAASSAQNPNLVPYKPKAWPAAIYLARKKNSQNVLTTVTVGETVYLNFAYANFGSEAAASHRVSVVLKNAAGSVIKEWNLKQGRLNVNACRGVTDIGFSVPAAGKYTAFVTLDFVNVLDETNESDNTSQLTFSANAPVSVQTVKFDANGGTGKMAAQTMTYGTAAKLRKNVFARSGYVFIGWAKSKYGAVAFTDAQRVKNLAANGGTVTLYAKWAKKNYKVKFYANAKNAKGKMSAQAMTYGKTKKLSANKFKRKGYVFKGWAKSKADAKKGKVAYKNKKSVKNLTTNGKTVKLYAVWGKK